MHPIRRELEFRFRFRATSGSGVRAHLASPARGGGLKREGDCRLGAAGPAPARADGAAFRRHRSGFGFWFARSPRAYSVSAIR